MSIPEIDTLKEGTVMMGDLQKVGWVVLKSGFNIKPNSDLENALYDVNIDSEKNKNFWFGIDKYKRQMYYKKTNNISDDTRFVKPNHISEIHDLLKDDCQVINDHLIEFYDFDDNNLYKCYNPNLIRNHGNVKIDQTLHCDYPRSVKDFTDVQKPPLKKRKTNNNRGASKEKKNNWKNQSLTTLHIK